MNKKIIDHYREAYNTESRLEKTFGTSIKYITENRKGDVSKWSKKFVLEIKRIMIKKGIMTTHDIDLKNIHKYVPKELIDFSGIDGTSKLGRMFYETDDEFILNYHNFIKWLYENVFDFDFYFQATPTIRFNCAGAGLQTVDTKLPYPRYHTDLEYGHPPQEINLWWSFTDNEQTGFEVANLSQSRKWYESYDFDFDKFTKISRSNNSGFDKHGASISQEVRSNEILLFDSRCIHSAIARKDSTTRISMDIRVNPVEDFVWPIVEGKPVYVGKGRSKAEFKPGGYRGYYPLPASGLA